jgi:hypothetical protein
MDTPTSFYKFWKFALFSKIKNNLKSAAQCWAKIGPRLQRAARWPATHGQSEGWLGHSLAAQSSYRGRPRAARAGAWSPRAACARDGAVAVSQRQGLGLEHHGDGGGRKCVGEGCGGWVAGVDERRLAWPCAEESEGEKRRGERSDVGWLFEAKAAKQGRGGSRGWMLHGGRKRGGERGPRARRGHVTRLTEQGRGEGADLWAVATVLGGGTG